MTDLQAWAEYAAQTHHPRLFIGQYALDSGYCLDRCLAYALERLGKCFSFTIGYNWGNHWVQIQHTKESMPKGFGNHLSLPLLLLAACKELDRIEKGVVKE